MVCGGEGGAEAGEAGWREAELLERLWAVEGEGTRGRGARGTEVGSGEESCAEEGEEGRTE
mgnify:FL=1